MPIDVQSLKGLFQRGSRAALHPLFNAKQLKSTFAEPPKDYKALPRFYIDHLKSLFSDPKKLKLALTDITPLTILGLAGAVPSIGAVSRLMPHRKVQTITGGIGNIIGGQLMQRTGLIGGTLGGLTGEALGRLIGSPFDKARVPDASTLAASMMAPRIQKAQGLEERIQSVLSNPLGKTGGVDDQTFSVDAMTYPTKSLHEIIDETPTKTVPISAFEKHMNNKVWSIEHPDHEDIRYSPKQVVKLINSGTYPEGDEQQHDRRIASADMSYPIIVAGWNNVILDGNHRLAKALAEGHEHLAVKVLTEIPESLKQVGSPTTRHLPKKAADDHVYSKGTEGKNKRYDVHQNDKNVAYAVVRPKSTEGDGPWVGGLYVHPEHRSHGLAHQMLRNIEEDHAGQTVRLRAKPYKDKGMDTDTLVAAYKRWGFTPYDPDEPTRLKKEIPKVAEEIQGIRVINPTTHDESIGGSNPRLADIPQQYGDPRSVANRGKWRPDIDTLIQAILVSPEGMNEIVEKDHAATPSAGSLYNQMEGLHHDQLQLYYADNPSTAGISGIPGKRIKDRALPKT